MSHPTLPTLVYPLRLTRAAGAPDGREKAAGITDGTLTVLVTGQLKHLTLLLNYSLC